jgi:hypothetical protein
MESGKRNIKSGREFEAFVDRPTGINETIKKSARLEDTIRFLPQAIRATYKQAVRVAPIVVPNYQSKSTYQICKEIWDWGYSYFQYNKDERGKEQIRSFRRSFWDRHIGIDCDDFTVLISSLLCVYKLSHILRVSMYKVKDGYQHIYLIVPTGQWDYITMDCVVHQFNYEVPFIKNIDVDMELQFLDGINTNEVEDTETILLGIDAQDLMEGLDEFSGLSGRKKIFGGGGNSSGGKGGGFKQKVNNFKQSKVGQALKKGVHVVNRVNPAAALLRAGILASLRLNIFKVSETLRYAYLSPEGANARNLDANKHQQVVSVKDKLEKIFFGAGGKAENFRAAILTGKGNHDKDVPLSGLLGLDGLGNSYSTNAELSDVIGEYAFATEMGNVEGLGSLGEPSTAAALAAATSVMTAIAGLLKSIGSLKKGRQVAVKDSGAESNTEVNTNSSNQNTSEPLPPIQQMSVSNENMPQELKIENSNSETESKSSFSSNNAGGENKSQTTEIPAYASTPDETENTQAMNIRTSTSNSSEVAKTTNASKGTFDKIKEWVSKNKVASGLIATGAIGLSAWGIYAITKRKEDRKSSKKSASTALSGTKTAKHRKNKKRRNKTEKIKYQKLR